MRGKGDEVITAASVKSKSCFLKAEGLAMALLKGEINVKMAKKKKIPILSTLKEGCRTALAHAHIHTPSAVLS